ncbi:MAG: Xaa-Pro peptidase family protein [Haloarculaceae archaeon]
MDPDLTPLDDHLEDRGVDGYLVNDDGDDADQYYLAGFHAPDPFVTLYDGAVHLMMMRTLELSRAKEEARAETVETNVDYGYLDLKDDHDPYRAHRIAIARFLDAHGVESVATPPRFPLATADVLREEGLEVVPDDESVVEVCRGRKTEVEVDHVRTAQRANERAMARAEELLATATVADDGTLLHDGEPLTSERVRQEIEIELLRQNCTLSETIVAGGHQAADAHERGSGPLHADEAIIVDIFPRHKGNRYHADMTRTFVLGDPEETVREWYELTLEAKRAALDAVEPGASGEDVHGAACDVYEDAGYPTLRTDPETETGYVHSTGHGVGLDVHEYPKVANDGPELEAGHVITIEPGLYDPDVGGVRIEDLVVVTEDGYENLTNYESELVVE